MSLIQPGMVAFDVGANVGYYTLLLGRGVGGRGDRSRDRRLFQQAATRRHAVGAYRRAEMI